MMTLSKNCTLVLLPGMDGTAILFDGFVGALGVQFKTIANHYCPVKSRTKSTA
jgi:hypothetical protein